MMGTGVDGGGGGWEEVGEEDRMLSLPMMILRPVKAKEGLLLHVNSLARRLRKFNI